MLHHPCYSLKGYAQVDRLGYFPFWGETLSVITQNVEYVALLYVNGVYVGN